MIWDFLFPKEEIKWEEKEEDGPFTSIKYSGPFDLKGLYKKLHDWLSDNDYKDLQVGQDYYETWYYHKETKEGLVFLKFKWSAVKNFSDEPEIKHFLDILVIIAPYNKNTKRGDLEIEIKSKRKYKVLKKSAKTTIGSLGLKEYEKKIKGAYKESAKKLYEDVYKFKKEIEEFLKTYYVTPLV